MPRKRPIVRCSSQFVHLVPNLPWCPRTRQKPYFRTAFAPYICPFGGTLALAAIFRQPETAQKLSIRKVFVSFWSIWCQTGQNYFSVSQHNVPQPSKPPFRLTFVPFWSSWRQTCPGGIFLASTVSHNSSKTNRFVGCSSHLGPSGANLALVTQAVLKQHFC